MWDIDKKTLIQGKVAEIFPDIPWLLDKKGELKKENFDACDAYVACLGMLNMEKYGNIDPQSSNVIISDDGVIHYDVTYCGKTEHRCIFLKTEQEA